MSKEAKKQEIINRYLTNYNVRDLNDLPMDVFLKCMAEIGNIK